MSDQELQAELAKAKAETKRLLEINSPVWPMSESDAQMEAIFEGATQ